jgi:sarcosine oxidase subunit alpha
VAITEIAANAATETMMFKRAEDDGRRALTIHVEGQAISAREGDTVSAALLASGLDVRRDTAVSGAKRLPYCMMGVCFDCLVTIDGVGNRQGCLVPVAEGMQIEIQKGKREIGK